MALSSYGLFPLCLAASMEAEMASLKSCGIEKKRRCGKQDRWMLVHPRAEDLEYHLLSPLRSSNFALEIVDQWRRKSRSWREVATSALLSLNPPCPSSLLGTLLPSVSPPRICFRYWSLFCTILAIPDTKARVWKYSLQPIEPARKDERGKRGESASSLHEGLNWIGL